MAWTTPRTWVAGEVVTAALLNTHLRDNLNAISGQWQNYTPTTSSLTPGTGATLTGRYTQIGKTVHFRAKVVLGTGFVMGTLPSISLPVAGSGTNFALSGNGWLSDAGTNDYVAIVRANGSSNIALYPMSASGVISTMGPTIPFTWAAGDSIEVAGSYEAA